VRDFTVERLGGDDPIQIGPVLPTLQELLAKRVGTYDEAALCRVLLEISLLDSAYQRSGTSDDYLTDAAKRYLVDVEKAAKGRSREFAAQKERSKAKGKRRAVVRIRCGLSLKTETRVTKGYPSTARSSAQQRVLLQIAYHEIAHVKLQQVLQPGGLKCLLRRSPTNFRQPPEHRQAVVILWFTEPAAGSTVTPATHAATTHKEPKASDIASD
jgi:hypothetical protein